MSSYNLFAKYYDRLTENVEYEVRSDYISDFFLAEGKQSCHLLDLACGTGSVTKRLTDKGFDVIGLDLSEEMLTIASSKCNAHFVKADMRHFDFNEAFDGCICCLDSINHLESMEEVHSCFESVARSIKKDCLFIFDVNTIYKHKCKLADNAFVFDEEDFFLAWDNELLEDNKIHILLDFFVYNGESYKRYSEEFIETAYSVEDIKRALKKYFDIIGIYNDLTLEAPNEKSERIYFICKRK